MKDKLFQPDSKDGNENHGADPEDKDKDFEALFAEEPANKKQKKEELNQEALEKSEAQIDDINSRLAVLSNYSNPAPLITS